MASSALQKISEFGFGFIMTLGATSLSFFGLFVQNFSGFLQRDPSKFLGYSSTHPSSRSESSSPFFFASFFFFLDFLSSILIISSSFFFSLSFFFFFFFDFFLAFSSTEDSESESLSPAALFRPFFAGAAAGALACLSLPEEELPEDALLSESESEPSAFFLEAPAAAISSDRFRSASSILALVCSSMALFSSSILCSSRRVASASSIAASSAFFLAASSARFLRRAAIWARFFLRSSRTAFCFLRSSASDLSLRASSRHLTISSSSSMAEESPGSSPTISTTSLANSAHWLLTSSSTFLISSSTCLTSVSSVGLSWAFS
mmetsp:Transcript_10/g.20  ORF Transcript_10/g.20 Transcript_10/m.20 type:complete len:320 (-) Transcript_10:857-1816(-)